MKMVFYVIFAWIIEGFEGDLNIPIRFLNKASLKKLSLESLVKLIIIFLVRIRERRFNGIPHA